MTPANLPDTIELQLTLDELQTIIDYLDRVQYDGVKESMEIARIVTKFHNSIRADTKDKLRRDRSRIEEAYKAALAQEDDTNGSDIPPDAQPSTE